MRKEIGYLGLGKMGIAQVSRLAEKGWQVVAWNRSVGPRKVAQKAGAEVCKTIAGVAEQLNSPRLIWLMVPHTAVDDVLKELMSNLSRGDTVIDGGNSFFGDSVRRAKELSREGINFLDVGTSGGPSGARHGACLMVGGDKKVFRKYEKLFQDLSAPPPYSLIRENKRIREAKEATERGENSRSGSYAYVGKAGAGHFVKMVHNGIEYGMMQAIAEGFAVLKASDFKLDLEKVAGLYNHKSVIESRLVGWLQSAYEKFGSDLAEVSSSVAHTGEGEWTVNAARELDVPVPLIEGAFKFRVASAQKPSYIGRVLSALRNQFGGHDFKNK